MAGSVGRVSLGDPYDDYKAAMRSLWKGWWIAWPPSQLVRVGDVFDISGGTQRRAGDLADKAVGFDSVPSARPSSFTYDSNGSVKIRFKEAGSIPHGFSALAKMDVGALIEFARDSAILVVYNGLSQEGFRDNRSVAAELTRLYWDGKWDAELVAVSEVVSAADGTVLTARQRGASAELQATAAAQIGPLKLVDLAGQDSFTRLTEVGLKWVGSALTPFYRVVRLRETWLNKIKTSYGSPQPGRGAAPVPVPPLLLEEAGDDPANVIENASEEEQPPLGDQP
jgi:hypothetical protein